MWDIEKTHQDHKVSGDNFYSSASLEMDASVRRAGTPPEQEKIQ
jgi:hypothetical protein